MQLALGSAIATRSYSDPEQAAYDRARRAVRAVRERPPGGPDTRRPLHLLHQHGEVALGAELAERVLPSPIPTTTTCSRYSGRCS